MPDNIEGFLEVGLDARKQIVLNLDRDRNGVGPIVFSPHQAEQFASLIMQHVFRAAGVAQEETTIPVERPKLGRILLCTFRYALGRQTYIVSDTCDWMRQYWSTLAPWHEQIHRDIQEAIAAGRAGMAMDVVQWQSILRLPVKGA